MDVIDPGSSGRAETDAIVEGPKWAGSTITFSFPGLAGFADYGGAGEVADNFAPFNAAQQAAVRAILTQISSFTGLTFIELGGASAAGATMRFGRTSAEDTAHAYLPSHSGKGGDTWVSNQSTTYDAPIIGNYAWMTILHEIGHALGLGHPFESDPPLNPLYDWMAYTVMSYSSTPNESGYYNNTGDFAQTYMMEDIAALQFLYGANYDFRAGNTVYRWDAATGEMYVDGIGQGQPVNNVIFSAVWDGGGIDTYDFSGNTHTSTRIDLNPGAWSFFSHLQNAQLGGGNRPPGNVANAFLANGDSRSLIENVIGSEAGDVIRGNSAANAIAGGGGDDEVYGNDGADLLEGGSGYDRMRGGNGNDALYGGSGFDSLGGDAGDDLLYGDDDNDQLGGGEGVDRLFGGAGNDELYGGDGNDFLDGSEDHDSLFGGAGDDRLTDLSGWNGLFGEEGSDVLTTGAGNDRLDGGPGADTMTGGLGDDFYYVDDAGDIVNENVGEGYDWLFTVFSTTLPDALEALEITGMGDVTLTGNASDNLLRANHDSNVLDGGAGADRMEGLAGDDIYYVDNPDDFVLEWLEAPGFDTVYASVSYTLPSSPPPPADPYAGASTRGPGKYAVEMLVLTGTAGLSGTGSDSGNTIVGNAGSNILDGLAGDDVLVGRLGPDTLIGGDGIDTASYAGDEGGVFVNLTLGRGYGNASFGDTYDSIENVIGTDYDDFIIGDPGVNRLDGAGGDDAIIGAVGADEIVGGSGIDWASYEDNSGTVFVNLTLQQGFNNAAHGDTFEGIENLVGGLMDDFFIGDDHANRLNGAMGADTLLGAGGADVFMFTYAPGAESTWGKANVDLILDFATGVDKIELAASAFTGLSAGALPPEALHAGTAAHDADDRIIYDAATGNLWFDPDGTGSQAAMLFATLGESSHPAVIAATDFAVV